MCSLDTGLAGMVEFMDMEGGGATHAEGAADDLFLLFRREGMIENDIGGGDEVHADAEFARIEKEDLEFPLFEILHRLRNHMGIPFEDAVGNPRIVAILAEVVKGVVMVAKDEETAFWASLQQFQKFVPLLWFFRLGGR